MRKRILTVAVALAGWIFFAPSPWSSVASAQTTLLDTTSTVTTSNSKNPRGSAYYANAHDIALTAGGSYTFTTQTGSQINDSGYNDSWIWLLDPSGATVANNDDFGGNLSSQITFTPQTSGTYTLIVTTYGAGQTMKYRLIITGPAAGTQGPVTIPNVRMTPEPRDFAAPQPVPVACDLGLQRSQVGYNCVAVTNDCYISAIS